MNSMAIEIERLSVTAGRKRILEVDALTVGSGELLAVMGPNGAGKSTLLRACLGMQPGASGRVRLFGQDLGRLGSPALTRLRRSVGYVPQALPVHGEMPLTVREVVSIGRVGRAGLFRPLSRADWLTVDDWMERLGIAMLAGSAFHELSGGEQRKTVLAGAMVQEPRLLLLDEPTANLDLGWRERIVETVRLLHAQNRLAVVLVCHELEALPPSCARVALLDHGQVIGDGPPEEALTDQQVAALYGPGLTAVHQGGRHAVIPRGGRT